MASTQTVQLKSGEFTAAAVGSSETKELFSMEKGDTVLFVYTVSLATIAGGVDSTWDIGDGGDTDRYYDGVTTVGTVGAFVSGATATVPYTYTAKDTIDVIYTQNSTDGSVAPGIRVVVGYVNASPA